MPVEVLKKKIDGVLKNQINAFDMATFKAWGIDDDDIPDGECAGIVTKAVDSRLWFMAKNNCVA